MHLAEIEVGTMAMGLLGGLAIFLFGMEMMTDSLKTVAGDGMRTLLARLTTNRFKGVLAGGVTTAIIQSSSVTTVLTVGFVSAGLMSLQQSVGIIMGAEIGTTITALLAALATSVPAALTIALVHTTFNIVAILILYVPPWWRYIPVIAAERLADVAVKQRLWAVAYVMGAFIVLPLIGVAVLR